MNTLEFGFGPGSGNRLLAVGLPDHIFASGDALLWFAETGFFIWRGERIEFRETEPIRAISGHDGHWVLELDAQHGVSLLGFMDEEWKTWSFEARSVEVGTRLVVLDHGHERTAFDLGGRQAWSMPVGARDGRPKPFADGLGVVWLDGTQVLRFTEGGKPRIAGRLPSQPLQWSAGPGGCAVFSLADGLWAMGASSGPIELGALDYESCRFSPDGTEMTAADPDGWARVNLLDGSVVERRRGSLVPVGYGPTPIILDEDAGLLNNAEGRTRATGLTPSAAAAFGGVLYGPGGTAWSAHTGEPLWDCSPLCGEHLAAAEGGVIQVGHRIEAFDTQGTKILDLPSPIDPEVDGEIFDLRWVDGMMFFEVEDGWVQVDLDGQRVGVGEPATLPPEDPDTPSSWHIDMETGHPHNGNGPVPLPFDGVLTLDDGRALAWSEDGMLVILDATRR